MISEVITLTKIFLMTIDILLWHKCNFSLLLYIQENLRFAQKVIKVEFKNNLCFESILSFLCCCTFWKAFNQGMKSENTIMTDIMSDSFSAAFKTHYLLQPKYHVFICMYLLHIFNLYLICYTNWPLCGDKKKVLSNNEGLHIDLLEM
jgi:hypothetical protein